MKNNCNVANSLLTVIWKFQLHLKMEKNDHRHFRLKYLAGSLSKFTVDFTKSQKKWAFGFKTQVQMQDANLWISVSKQTGANVAYNCSWWSLHIKLEIKASSCILRSQRLWNFTVYENIFHNFLFKGGQLEHSFCICIVCGSLTVTNWQFILNSF